MEEFCFLYKSIEISNTAGLCGSAMKQETFIASKGSNLYILFAFTEAGVVAALKRRPVNNP